MKMTATDPDPGEGKSGLSGRWSMGDVCGTNSAV